MKTKKNLITNELRLEMCKNHSENVQRIKENKRSYDAEKHQMMNGKTQRRQ